MGLLALIAAALLAGGWLQTAPGKRQLAEMVGRLASDDTQTVEIAGIEGWLPFELRIARITVSDGAGAWLRVEDAALDWSPISLLFGRLEIESLTARHVAVDRSPIRPEEPAGADSTVSLPLEIRAEHVAVPVIELAEPVLGAPARLSLDGMVELAEPRRGIRLVAAVRRIDATAGTLDIVLAYEPEAGRLAAEIQAAEPPGGVVARLLDLPGLPAVELDLTGEGPVDNWRAQLAVDAGPDLSVDADVGIAEIGSGHLVTLEADAALAGLAAGPGRALLAGRSRLSGRVLVGDDGQVTLDRIGIETAAGTLTAIGEADWRRGTVDTGLAVTAGDPTVFADILPDTAWGGAELDLRILGAIADPRIEATLAVRGLETHGAAVSAISAEAILDRVADAGGRGLRFWGEGSLVGPSFGAAELDALLASDVTWQASGVASLDGSAVFEQLRIVTAGVDLDASGDLASDGSVTAVGTLSIDDLGRLQPLLWNSIGGQAELSLQADVSDGAITLSTRGAVAGPRSGLAGVDALLRESAEMAADLVVHPDGMVDIDGIRIAGGDNVLTGRATLAGDRLAADWGLSVPSIAPVSNAYGVAADGRVTGAGRIEGPLDRLAVRADVSVETPAYDGMTLPDFVAHLELDDVAGFPSGLLRLEGQVEGETASLATGLTVTPDGGVRLDPIEATHAGLSATGALDLMPDGLVAGRLTAHVDDVASLAARFDLPLSGQADVTTELSVREGAQDLRTSVEMLGPILDAGSAESVTADLSIEDLGGEGRLQVRAGASGLSAGGMEFDRVDVDARGNAEALAMSLAATGADLSGDASANIERSGRSTRIGLATMRARFRGVPFELAAPAMLEVAPGSLSVDRLVVRAEDGRLELAGSLGETLDASLELVAVPLTLLALADLGLPVDGTIDGSARVEGPATQPEASFELRSVDLSSGHTVGIGLPSAEFNATGRWSGGRVDIEADARLADNAGLELAASLPARPSPDGPFPVLDRNGTISARAAGTLDVALFDDMLAAAGNRVAGQLSLDFEASGTMAAPMVEGTAALNDGRYENAFYGSRLEDISASLTASGTALRLTELSATTPGGGTFTGTGSLDIDPARGYPFQLDAVLRNGTVVDTALVSAAADADLRLGGALADKLLLSGEVLVLSAEFRIPDRLPASVPELPVEEVNLPPELAAARAERQPASPAAAVDADLDIVASARQGIFVRGRGLEVELAGDLSIRGSTAAPAIGGALTLRSGILDLLGRRLTFQRGGLDFDGTSRLDPELDLLAVADVSDATIEVELGGRVSEPRLSFRSVPELPPDEIAARLLFGKDVLSLSPVEAALLAQSAGQLAGSSPGLPDQVRRSVGLDRLDVEVGDEEGETSVSGGRYVGDGVYVGVEQGLNEQSSRANVEIELTPNVTVESEVGADAQGRIGVRLEWDY